MTGIKTISGVSGGSILAAFLAENIPRPWPTTGPIPDFDIRITQPFRDFTRKNIRTLWFFKRLLPWNWARSSVAVDSLARRYAQDINSAKLAGLPAPDEGPRFVFCATDMVFGINWEADRTRVGSYVPGYVSPPPDWPVARAVAASSCFPPVFEPMADAAMRSHGRDWVDTEAAPHARLPLCSELVAVGRRKALASHGGVRARQAGPLTPPRP